uniref:F-box and leucine rich repeat protein 12 n=2 Tax=Latimeria chalumnae TaxID=7897 RepID=M3XIZ2_LATCH
GGKEELIHCLPESVLLEIFTFLPVKDLLRIGRVCKRWRRLVYDKRLWKEVDLTPYKISSKILWHLVRHYLGTSLRTLKVKGLLHSVKKQEFLKEALLSELAKRCPNLTELYLTETDLRPLSFLCLPATLKTLKLTHCEIHAQWFKTEALANGKALLPKLEELVLNNVPSFSDLHLQHLSLQNPLKALILSGTYRVTDVGIQRSAAGLKGMEHLKLHGCNITDGALHFVGRHMKELRVLDLTNFCSCTDAGLSCLADLKKLESLCLEYCHLLTPDAVISVCTGLPYLRQLNLNGIPFEGQALLRILQSLPNCVVTNTYPDMSSMPKF